MFIKTHTNNQNMTFAFARSSNVQAFPCGRRRSIKVDTNQTRIPFDPEARLNTELNNRRHSSLNGFTQTYLDVLDATNGNLSLVVAGYLFNVNFPQVEDKDAQNNTIRRYWTSEEFINAVVEASKATTAVYANILVEEVSLFSGEPKDYTTWILGGQHAEAIEEQALDLPSSDTLTDSNSYYFSGLSFSNAPLTNVVATRSITKSEGTKQILASLCILEKNDAGIWQIHEPAYLPKIEHGDSPDSIVVNDTLVRKDITVEGNINVAGTPTAGGGIQEGTGDIFAANKIEAPHLKAEQDIQTENLGVTGVISATVELEDAEGNPKSNAEIHKADIDILEADELSADSMKSKDIQQYIEDADGLTGGFYTVPVLFLQEQTDTEGEPVYQLQIKRTNFLAED